MYMIFQFLKGYQNNFVMISKDLTLEFQFMENSSLSGHPDPNFQNRITAAHRRPAKAVSLKKIYCFFVARFRSRPFRPVQIVVVSEGEIFLPRRLAFLIFARSKKQRENFPFRLANFKARWCRE